MRFLLFPLIKNILSLNCANNTFIWKETFSTIIQEQIIWKEKSCRNHFSFLFEIRIICDNDSSVGLLYCQMPDNILLSVKEDEREKWRRLCSQHFIIWYTAFGFERRWLETIKCEIWHTNFTLISSIAWISFCNFSAIDANIVHIQVL